MQDIITIASAFEVSPSNGKTPIEHVRALNLEMAMFGYTLSHEAMVILETQTDEQFSRVRDQLISAVAEIKGANLNHNVLFRNFPYDTPEHKDAIVMRMLQLELFQMGTNYHALECGHVVEPIFEREDIGACPLCGHANGDLEGTTHRRHDFQNITPLTILGVFDAQARQSLADRLLARPMPLTDKERRLMLSFKDDVQWNVPAKLHRENFPMLVDGVGPEEAAKHVKSVTDVLRVAVGYSGGDISMAGRPRFKLTRSHKRKILTMLNVAEFSAPTEDMMRHREEWLRLGEKLNPGTEDNKKRYPRAFAMFDEIRNREDEIATFERKLNRAVDEDRLDDVLRLLSSRPGEFGRRLDATLRRFRSKQDQIVDAFREVAHELPTQMMFKLRSHFEARLHGGHKRIFSIKSSERTVTKSIPDTRPAMQAKVVSKLQDHLEKAMIKRFSALPSMGKVFIDDSLRRLVIPFNRRQSTDGSVELMRGSSMPYSKDLKILRLFIWWKGYTDIDLSAVLMNDAYEHVDSCSFTRTRGDDMVHSGDILSAPMGAAEFIDVDTARVKGRYLLMTVNNYSGRSFKDIPCFAGFMERDSVASGEGFEPASVKMKFILNSESTTTKALLFDLKEREFTFLDVQSAQRTAGQAISRELGEIPAIMKEIEDHLKQQTTLYDLVEMHVRSRGELVSSREEADIVVERTDDNLMAIVDEYLV